MEKKIKSIIVDDEPLALKRIGDLLKDVEDIEVIVACQDGKEAIEAINNNKPDLVFLDIQMPELSGFEILKNIDSSLNISVIFVTAYDEFAIKAFDVHALDYLLKPFKKERFYASLERAKNEIRHNQQNAIGEKVSSLLNTLQSEKDTLTRIMVKASGRYFFLKVSNIDWIESAGNYVRIHSGGEAYLIRETMINMEQKLDADIFFRIHRSTIVNVDKVKELEQWFHGDYKITMTTGKELTMSRNYKKMLQQF